MSFTFCAQKVLGESCCWGGVTGESPRWRSSLLCQQSGRCWGSSVWRVPLWTELPAAPQLPLDRTAIAATYNAAAAWDWQRRGHTVKQTPLSKLSRSDYFSTAPERSVVFCSGASQQLHVVFFVYVIHSRSCFSMTASSQKTRTTVQKQLYDFSTCQMKREQKQQLLNSTLEFLPVLLLCKESCFMWSIHRESRIVQKIPQHSLFKDMALNVSSVYYGEPYAAFCRLLSVQFF